MDSTTPVTPALLPAQGRQTDGKRQRDPPPYRPRPGRTTGGNGARPPPPPPARPCQLELTPLGSALSPQRWRVNLGASHGEGVYKRKHRPWWPVCPCSPSQRADRQPGGTSPALGRGGRRSDGASVRPLPPCTSVDDPAGLLSASYPCARQSAIRRCRTPPSPPPPCPGPVHVDWGLPARATRFTTHSPTLGTGFIADGTPKSRKRLPRPSSESVGLQSSSAGVRSQALVLLGSLHVELSSWRRGNHPPLQQLAPPPIPVDRVEVSFVLPPTLEKQNTWEPPTPAAVRTVTCTRTGRREASSGIRRDRWETIDHGVRTSSFAARAGCATSRAAAF